MKKHLIKFLEKSGIDILCLVVVIFITVGLTAISRHSHTLFLVGFLILLAISIGWVVKTYEK